MSTTVTAELIKIQEKPHGFGSGNPNWSYEPTINEYFIQTVQANVNAILLKKGYLTLNTVFEMLGLEETEEGALAGWVGDAFVDFGMNRFGPFKGEANVFTLVFNVNSTNVFVGK